MKANGEQDERPLLALTAGDPAGIGPEIVAAALRDERVRAAARVVVIGPRFLRKKLLAPGTDWLDADGKELLEPVTVGRAQVAGGRAALAALRRGHELALAGEVDALVTAPVCKEALHMAGEPVEGQTELLSRWAGAADCQMLAIAEEMRVLIATRHMALAAAIASLTPELIHARLILLDASLRELGFAAPRLALAGLNPHASEGGLFGDEEARILAPALATCRAAGLDVTGPEPPDTVFVRAAAGRFDAVLALYHDQGFIPVKLAAPETGITLLLGMPYLRISPAHGTAFDIAGQGLANPENQIAALCAAADFARARRREGNSRPG
jgi:4-hydroxythreonine-4-phosphate dehydrogenase